MRSAFEAVVEIESTCMATVTTCSDDIKNTRTKNDRN
jgi:hypothetical protein